MSAFFCHRRSSRLTNRIVLIILNSWARHAILRLCTAWASTFKVSTVVSIQTSSLCPVYDLSNNTPLMTTILLSGQASESRCKIRKKVSIENIKTQLQKCFCARTRRYDLVRVKMKAGPFRRFYFNFISVVHWLICLFTCLLLFSSYFYKPVMI